jgi:hypothetical protein
VQLRKAKPEGDGADSPTRAADAPEVRSGEAARPRKKYWHNSLFKTLLNTTGKLGGCYFSLAFIFKNCAFRKQPPNFPQLLNYK